jgi:hypothetical protein
MKNTINGKTTDELMSEAGEKGNKAGTELRNMLLKTFGTTNGYLNLKNMSKFILTIEQLQEQSDKYQAQLAALEIDESYKDFEENRTLLRNFYTEKISEFTAEINKFKAVENV